MPATVVSLKARMRDHSMSIPVPENTIRHGIPNACNLCHRDKDADWALQRVTAWYGDKSRQNLIRRADAFTQARKGDPAAIPVLLQILSDPIGRALDTSQRRRILRQFPRRSLGVRCGAPFLLRFRAACACYGGDSNKASRGPAGSIGS